MEVSGSEALAPVHVRQLESAQLARLCADNTGDSVLWTEFLRRFSGKIRSFIRGTMEQFASSLDGHSGSTFFGEAEWTDLFQNTILRLVQNDCEALRRFSGAAEADLLAYLAIIARSTVRDYLRYRSSRKRQPETRRFSVDVDKIRRRDTFREAAGHRTEREVLQREVVRLSRRVIRSQPARDQLVFELYFSHDLTASQIAGCKGIGLTKTGVERVLDRLMSRVRNAVV